MVSGEPHHPLNSTPLFLCALDNVPFTPVHPGIGPGQVANLPSLTWLVACEKAPVCKGNSRTRSVIIPSPSVFSVGKLRQDVNEKTG